MATSFDRAPQAVRASAHDQDEDAALIRAVAKQDRRAFETLYYRHSRRLGRYLMRILRQPAEVEEALNDVMLVIWQNAARFDPGVARFTTWLFGIAHKKALKLIASRRPTAAAVGAQPFDDERFDADQEPDAPLERADAHDPERALLGRELGGLLAKALDQLSPEHRAVIQLAFGEDCSYEEIASITGSPLNTVKTRVFHARKRLAEILRRADVSYPSAHRSGAA
jgi:RNA polymerase sigma-70 factor, ECF subfamily